MAPALLPAQSPAPVNHNDSDNDDDDDDDDGSPSSVTMSGLGGHTLALEEEQVARELLPSDAVVRCGVTNIFFMPLNISKVVLFKLCEHYTATTASRHVR